MTAEFGLFDQQEAQARVGAAVLDMLPDGAVSIALTVSELVPVSAQAVTALLPDGTRESIRMSRRFDSMLISRLREVMYREGAGTWFSMVMEVDPAGSVRAQFDYDDEGDFGFSIDEADYVTDQERYPRSVENQPEWLKERLAEGERLRAARRR